MKLCQFCGKDCDKSIHTQLFLASWKSTLDLSVHLFVPHNMKKKYEQPLVAWRGMANCDCDSRSFLINVHIATVHITYSIIVYINSSAIIYVAGNHMDCVSGPMYLQWTESAS